MRPCYDPDAPARPGMAFIGGRWRSRASVDASNARHNPRRVGSNRRDYVGMAPTTEQAAQLNDEMRAFARAQKGAE